MRAAHRRSLSCPPPLAPARRIWFAFCEYDLDGDGKITIEELRKVLVGETDENINKYIAEYDLDKSGCIEYEEFARMLLPPSSIKASTKAVALVADASAA